MKRVPRASRPPLLSVMLLIVLTVGCNTAFAAEIETSRIEYKIGDAAYEGYLARPKDAKNAPAVLVIHDWMGENEFARERADELARLGYIAFAADLYGKGKRGTTPEEAGALAGPFRKDKTMMRTRMAASLETLKKQAGVDATKIAAMGFCFGGTAVLELARSGADVRGVVSFHGGIEPVNLDDGKNIKGKVLVLHGNLDPLVPPEHVAKFMTEMNTAKVWYRFVGYPLAVHSFTNPKAGNDITQPTAYNAEVAAQAYAEMRTFFSEILK
jgi:dienelactone hydrolase